MIRVVREPARGWWVVRSIDRDGYTVRAVGAATLAAAVWRYRFVRRETWVLG